MYKQQLCFLGILAMLSSLFGCAAQPKLPHIDFQLATASVQTLEDKLIVSTGRVSRTWQLSGPGLKTILLENLESGEEYSNPRSTVLCDWSYNGIINDYSKAKLISLTASQSNDEGFTSDHIEVVAEFEYPEVETFVKYVIWVYPNAPGVRTQLFIKGNGGHYISASDRPAREDIRFKLLQGHLKSNYNATAFADLPIAAATEDSAKVVYHISGFDCRKKYTLGFTWWDFEGLDIHQNVWVTSVDGETKHQIFADEKLPNFKLNNESFEMKLADLPNDVLMDGSFKIIFEKNRGDKAIVSEIFVFERDGENKRINNGQVERLNVLRQIAPPETALIAYVDCGVPISGEKLIPTGRVDFVPCMPENSQLKFIGYYNDTQHRNKPETPLSKEELLKYNNGAMQNNWSSIVCMEKNGNGVIVVKESHKCVNQYGVDTGDFEMNENGIENRGTSLFPDEIKSDKYSWCWASWSILFEGGQDEMELAIKEFDRFRFPIDESRDVYIQANTWGSDRGRKASVEENVLVELESQKDLGIDIQQIDDGWQAVSIRMSDAQKEKDGDVGNADWHVRKDWYPDGWKNVVAKSEETGVQLGLWGAAQPITLDALKWNYDQGGFITYKLDFADLGTHQKMDELIGKVRDFIKYTNHRVRVNWDLTENAPRYGYFWAKEYGCVYLENRKPKVPENAIYVPSLVLRDIWQLSKYTNVNRFQTSIQNINRVDKSRSDAYLHNHPYSVAIGLVGTPLFFQETQFYSKSAKDEIRPVLAKYKEHRNEMFRQYVFPVGDEPNNASWTGFQWIDVNRRSGYLMIFRELNNPETEMSIALRFLKNKKIEITNLMDGKSSELMVGDEGKYTLTIDNPADYRFLKYRILDE